MVDYKKDYDSIRKTFWDGTVKENSIFGTILE